MEKGYVRAKNNTPPEKEEFKFTPTPKNQQRLRQCSHENWLRDDSIKADWFTMLRLKGCI